MLPGSYQCKSCGLIFLPEEISTRYDLAQRWCVRCVLLNKNVAIDGMELPKCFGKLYDGAAPACTRVCQVTQPCLIQFVDDRSIDWSLSIERRGVRYSKGRIPLSLHAIRILKAAGRPMHIIDLCPLVHKASKGRLNLGHKKSSWHPHLRSRLVRSPDVVALGNDFFIWIGCWNPNMGGQVGYQGIYDETKQLTPVKEIIKKIRGEGDA